MPTEGSDIRLWQPQT